MYFLVLSIFLLSGIFIRDCSGNTAAIKSLRVVSTISSRFANTLVSSVVTNIHGVNHEAKFSVQLPEKAFVSNFSMFVNNTLYIGKVKSKKEAEKEYEEAKHKGLNTGIVKTTEKINPEREMDIFEISMAMPANSNATFLLEYQQLLERSRGFYEHVLSIRPRQIVEDLRVDVYVNESQRLRYFDVMEFRKNPADPVVAGNSHAIRDISSTSAHVMFTPTIQQQKEQGSDTGLSGDFIVRYDVEHKSDTNSVGLIQSNDGYFVHYFSPLIPQALGKNVIFVIDISGSMSGEKIEQTRDAMRAILGQLREQDGFNILLFNSAVQSWKPALIEANKDGIAAARAYVNERVKAGGGTNINDALLKAITALGETYKTNDAIRLKDNAPMIVFLTDGLPSSGETKTEKIRSNVKGANDIDVTIFALGFGDGVNIDFLRALAFENNGFARKIYTDKDASKQLEGFFLEVESPLLLRVKMEYSVDVIEAKSITSTSFPAYFNGSELVVAGKIRSDAASKSLVVKVSGKGSSSAVQYQQTTDVQKLQLAPNDVTIQGFTERLWAYLTIKQLLKSALIASSEDKVLLEARALKMSLQYNFVTPLTAFVVVQNSGYVNLDSALEVDVGSRAIHPSHRGGTAINRSGKWSLACVLLIISVIIY